MSSTTTTVDTTSDAYADYVACCVDGTTWSARAVERDRTAATVRAGAVKLYEQHADQLPAPSFYVGGHGKPGGTTTGTTSSRKRVDVVSIVDAINPDMSPLMSGIGAFIIDAATADHAIRRAIETALAAIVAATDAATTKQLRADAALDMLRPVFGADVDTAHDAIVAAIGDAGEPLNATALGDVVLNMRDVLGDGAFGEPVADDAPTDDDDAPTTGGKRKR